jgi:hypothetical protein
LCGRFNDERADRSDRRHSRCGDGLACAAAFLVIGWVATVKRGRPNSLLRFL